MPFLDLYETVLSVDVIGTQIGASIHLPPESSTSSTGSTNNLWYRSIDETNAYMTTSNFHLSAHDSQSYLTKLCHLVHNSVHDPLPIHGYSLGTSCTKDYECDSTVNNNGLPVECVNHSCALRLAQTGERCIKSSDCQSNRCDYTTWTTTRKTCYEPKRKGSMCSEDSDCLSGTCTWLWMCQ
jgi:hypothetical protein